MQGLKPLTRDELSAALDLIDRAEAAMGDLPHRLAVPAVYALTELRAVLGETLPGGLFCRCEACGVLIGNYEESASDEEGTIRVCGDCAEVEAEAA